LIFSAVSPDPLTGPLRRAFFLGTPRNRVINCGL
jgi:hypothetical protein